MGHVLETRGITKNFTGTKALDDVSIYVEPGEVHGIVGENGAGKSTLMKILSGIYRKDSGEIFLNGKQVEFNNPNEAIQSGIGIVHQEVSIVPNLSVAENIFANRQPVNALGLINRKQMNQDTMALLEEFGARDIDPGGQVRFLTIAQQQVLEILKAMSCNPSVLILDEPTSSLTDNESEALFASIRRLKEKGTSFIYISHHLDEIFKICDSISILKDGRFVCRADVKDIDQPFIVRNMVGREITDEYGSGQKQRTAGEVIFEARQLGRVSEFAKVDFKLRKSEIVGVFGLVGAGRTELASSFVGLTQPETGELYFEGKPVKIRSMKQAISMGMAYVSEDRKNSGLFLKKTIRDNIVANKLKKIAKGPFISKKTGDRMAEDAIDRYSVACSSKEQLAGDLSGGNQQKILVAEWLSDVPRVLIVDEPTKGIDVGSRSQIYGFINDLANQGTAVMMISSDLMEIIGMSDRVVVMKDGFVAGEVAKEDMTEEHILSIATGVNQERGIPS
ncbi:MAG: sugar ABC transporter ATP-binding protein [Blautia sp.]|nr:sugar ABC transporter ATP-binding protein [Blautia sp.]